MKLWMYPLLVVFGAACYGILSTIIKLAIQDGFTASEAVTSQYYTGFLLALIIFILVKRGLPTIRGSFPVLIAGLFTAITGTVYGKAVEYMPASLAVVLLFQFTWIGMLYECVLSKRLPKQSEGVSLVFLFGGTILAAGLIDVDVSGIPWQGWAWGLAAAFSFAAFVTANQQPVPGMDVVTRLFLMSFYAAIAITFFQSPEILWNGMLGDGLWIYGTILGVFGIVLPIFLFSIGVPKVGAGMSSILSAVELPVAIIASMLLLGERLTLLQFLGIFLVLFGMTWPAMLQRFAMNRKLRLRRAE
ncbi:MULTISPECIES: EamA family transporter [unclassified Sporosarcina]|uniref:EamA family transporter n=1 Tax=unclassified Sporosarcina TaxID=2647733 RepID=UPI000C16D4C4|nr:MULTISPECIES: DMT family transporter [unclassified Sporosarcina]PIC69977.1 EamA family transporter [Sporosarcina sp. P16b]PID01699.1 EamA family transporter [Sporosarcina sp. P2]PID25333.1 EamA family transporter [Sporosarcina sp. P7]